jgi:hypothetical protein
VDEPVDHGGGDHVVAEDFAPAAEALVGGDDERGAFVWAGDELEEQVRRFGFEGDVADFVDDQQRVAGQPAQLVLQPAGVVGGGEPVDPFAGGGEQDPVPALAGADAQAGGQVGLAGAGWAEEDDVVAGGDEVQGAQAGDDVALEAAGVLEVEVLQGFAGREPPRWPPSAAARPDTSIGSSSGCAAGRHELVKLCARSARFGRGPPAATKPALLWQRPTRSGGLGVDLRNADGVADSG